MTRSKNNPSRENLPQSSSDADLVAELYRLHRAELAHFEYLAQAPIEEKPSIYSRSAAAIERLTRAREQDMADRIKALNEAWAERERLEDRIEVQRGVVALHVENERNLLAERDRLAAEQKAERAAAAVIDNGLLREIARLRDALERVTRERDAAREDAGIDERIGLRATNFAQSRELSALKAERDRLRAALEKSEPVLQEYDQMHPKCGNKYISEVLGIVRDALAGANTVPDSRPVPPK